jgi:hypothetical protein
VITHAAVGGGIVSGARSGAEHSPELGELGLDPGAHLLAKLEDRRVGDPVEGAGARFAAGHELLGPAPLPRVPQRARAMSDLGPIEPLLFGGLGLVALVWLALPVLSLQTGDLLRRQRSGERGWESPCSCCHVTTVGHRGLANRETTGPESVVITATGRGT